MSNRKSFVPSPINIEGMSLESIHEAIQDCHDWPGMKHPSDHHRLAMHAACEAMRLENELELARAELKQAPAMVVPELPTWEDGDNKLRRGEKLTALEKFVMDHDWHKTDTTFRDGLEAVFAELRTIPSCRVLGDGMEAVDREEIDLLRLLRDRAIDTAPAGELRGIAKDALRTNQGGAEHGNV